MREGYTTGGHGRPRRDKIRFDTDVFGHPQVWTVHHRGLEYSGEVIVSDTVDPQWGQALRGSESFRLVFFTVPRRLSRPQIRDPRIAMVVPRRAYSQPWRKLNLELDAIREAMAHYRTARDPHPEAVRRSMEEREVLIRGEMGHLYAASYSDGRVYTRQGVHINPHDVFTDEVVESWAERLVSALLDQAYPDLIIDHKRFPRPLTSDAVVTLYRGIFQGDRAGQELVRGFAPGLGLATSGDSARFDAEACPALKIMERELEAHQGELGADRLLHVFTHQYGIPRTLAALFVLSFVRQFRAEVELRDGHSVQDLGGRPFLSDRVTWDFIPEISFSKATGHELYLVRRRPSLVWNAVLPYAALIVEGLQTSRDASEIAAQERRLLEGLRDLCRRLEGSTTSLEELGASLGEEYGKATGDLDRLQLLCSAADYRGFHAVLQDSFDGPADLERLLDVNTRVERLCHVAPAITDAGNYLSAMTFDLRHKELELERDSVAARIGLDSLLADPSLWSSIVAGYGRLRVRYAEIYGSHHLDYHEDAQQLRHTLHALMPQVEALSRFNAMPELGQPVGADVPDRFRELEASLRTCAGAMPPLDVAPECQSCLLPLAEDVPRRQAEILVADTETAMREHNRRLSSHSARRILAEPSREQLDKFIDLVHVGDLSALANVLDDEVMEFLRQYVGSE